MELKFNSLWFLKMAHGEKLFTLEFGYLNKDEVIPELKDYTMLGYGHKPYTF